jgi:large subunit ribosomal protein L25
MKEEFDLIADFREGQGKGASRRLRREGRVPAIIYGGGRPPRALSFDHNRVLRQLENESFYSSILNIKVGDNNQPAIVKDIQRHPAKRQVLHMDFQRILADQKIRMHIPIHFVGGEMAPGVKTEGGSVSQLMSDVEISCLPKDLPEYFEVDISGLHLNDMLHLSDIKVGEGVEIVELSHGEGHDQPIVNVHVIKAAPLEDEEEAVAEGDEEAADKDDDASDEEAEGESQDD